MLNRNVCSTSRISMQTHCTPWAFPLTPRKLEAYVGSLAAAAPPFRMTGRAALGEEREDICGSRLALNSLDARRVRSYIFSAID